VRNSSAGYIYRDYHENKTRRLPRFGLVADRCGNSWMILVAS
jgi:hypothetical protein